MISALTIIEDTELTQNQNYIVTKLINEINIIDKFINNNNLKRGIILVNDHDQLKQIFFKN